MDELKFGKFLLVFLILTTLLVGCDSIGSSAVSQEADVTSEPAIGPLQANYENALPVVMQLALGLFKLDDTSAPLTSEQAASLVPLWKAYRSMTASGESSSKEVEALIVQIQGTLTEDQLQAIADMQLTMQDLIQLSQERNLSLGGGGGPGLSPEERATRQAQRFEGGGSGSGGGPGQGRGMGPPGGFPPGGEGMIPGGEMPPGAMTTPGARQTAIAQRPAGFNNLVSPALAEALIAYLETKAP